MSVSFTPVGADGRSPDSTKSVRYVEGMVLGVDDFQQEHAYLAGLAGAALRDGVGVGTLSGLKVTTAKTDKIEVRVGPGAAIDGRGRIVRVPDEQCADVAAWFGTVAAADFASKVVTDGPQLAGTLSVAVTVGYARTATDSVPVPGEPCRSDDQLMAASRWRDDYKLDLSLVPPPSSKLREAFRQFLSWTTYALTFAEPAPIPAAAWDEKADAAAAFLSACAAAEKTAATGRLLPSGLPNPLPAGGAPVGMNNLDVELESRCLDAASAVLVSELLPDWLGPAAADADERVLLAELTLAVKRAAATDPWELDVAAAPKSSSRARPVARGGPTLRLGPRVP